MLMAGGMALSAAGLLLVFAHPFMFGSLFLLGERLSPDHHLEPVTITRLAILVY